MATQLVLTPDLATTSSHLSTPKVSQMKDAIETLIQPSMVAAQQLPVQQLLLHCCCCPSCWKQFGRLACCTDAAAELLLCCAGSTKPGLFSRGCAEHATAALQHALGCPAPC